MSYSLPTRMKEVDLDFGSTPVVDKSFTIIDSDITTDKVIIVLPSAKPSVGRQGVDFEVDIVQFSAASGTGELTIYAVCNNGHLTGKRKVIYVYN